MKKIFINPKSLKGKEIQERMKELMGPSLIKENSINSVLELTKKAPDGIIYGIVREGHKYFIKTSKSDTLIPENFEYIGGLANKTKERYDSYADAIKRLNLKFDAINESFGVKNNINIFETDTIKVEKKEEDLVDEEKFVLKVKDDEAPSEETNNSEENTSDDDFEPFSSDEESNDIESEESSDSEDFDSFSDDSEDDLGGDDEETDPIKIIQKLTGKLAQKIRSLEESDPELEKYVINSIISAVNLEGMDKKDKNDIIKKIKKGGLKDVENSEEETSSEDEFEPFDSPSDLEDKESDEITPFDSKSTKKEEFINKKNVVNEMHEFEPFEFIDLDSVVDEPDFITDPAVVPAEPIIKPTEPKPEKPSRRSLPFTKPNREIKPGQEPFPDPAPKMKKM